MEEKRKRLTEKSRTENVRSKKQRKIYQTNTTVGTSMDKRRVFDGPLVTCFKRQQEHDKESVSCPVCSQLVYLNHINEHLDTGCNKKILTCTSAHFSTTRERFSKNCAEDRSVKLQINEDICKKRMDMQDSCSDEVFKSSKVYKEDEKNDIDEDSITEPYYLKNLMFIVDAVLADGQYCELFNADDQKILKRFHNLSINSRKLYARLFQRQYKWFRACNIRYPKISEDLTACFDELIVTGFLLADLNDLAEILKLLSASEVVDLAKFMHISRNSQNKSQLVTLLLKQSRQNSFFSKEENGVKKAICKRANAMLGTVVKLESDKRSVFTRLILLYVQEIDDRNDNTQLSTIFFRRIGQGVYPDYVIRRVCRIFRNRDDLICCDVANQALFCLNEAIERKKFDKAMEVFEEAYEKFKAIMRKLALCDPATLYSSALPEHLRQFTTPWLYTRICSCSVEILQRYKKYDKAVELLRELLGQQDFCPSNRGRWWERLALNLHQHMNKPAEALDVVREGLADTRVRTGHRLALEERAKNICESRKNASLKKHLSYIQFTELKQPPVVTISGVRLSTEPIFIVKDEKDEKSFCSVEQLAIIHYREQGYNEGIHGEGMTFNLLFTLIMWDVIFCDTVPDVFRNPYQSAPLDIYSGNFYANRKAMIDARVQEIHDSPVEKIKDDIRLTWQEQFGKTCAGVNWNLFANVNKVLEFISCVGSVVLAGICSIFAKDYRHTRSGLPDLVVWNFACLKYKIVEVKGPNDKLSTKQKVWLDALVRLGAYTEVLYVKVGGRQA
ncbi:fanconi-associated nuclease 1-like isoform X2 [Xenia sp. Carnegie-2017]|uniref:fanconi-associated nuclease 1-like isoform X2 n=1 Tax=Xenia sp. Carnegie-2017 TaxID=2897299 RepID=UPI001F0359E6|nr:fanconi-associated nuclease 1-like isoform X2 [Xenia sp. Carnegie-2017]